MSFLQKCYNYFSRKKNLKEKYNTLTIKIYPCALTEHHVMKACWGSGGIAPLFLWPRYYTEVSGQIQAPAALTPGKEPLGARFTTL
jgi:hypothetical protein